MGVPWWPSSEGSGIVTTMAQVPSLAWERLHATGAAKKKKKKNTGLGTVVTNLTSIQLRIR